MEPTIKLKEKFCKDCNIPIRIYQEPYFTDRLKLYDRFYGTLEKWSIFVKELEKYSNEQEYFEEYNKVKDAAINYIKSTEAYQKLNEEDMSKYAIKFQGLQSKDIFHSSNDGRTFISIDMKKANFTSLHFYNKRMFGNAENWEEFIGMFTENKHIINSKYIRQVILGNCNPKRHITYEKYLMDRILDIFKNHMGVGRVVSLSNDEIIYDITDCEDKMKFYDMVKGTKIFVSIPLKIECFTLHKIVGTNGYYKEIYKENGQKEIEFKGLDNLYLPFVIRHFLEEEVTDSDKVFYHNGLLAQFVEVPEIEVNLNGN